MKLSICRHLLLVFLFVPVLGSAQVVLNEYTCSNLNTHLDDYGKYEDWIELYNMGDETVDLTGFHLTDNSDIIGKYPIPAGISIEPGGFAMFYCDGRDVDNHTNFKINQTKNSLETLVLSDPSLNVLDSLQLIRTQLSHTIGRSTDGDGQWSIYKNDTPGATNTTSTAHVRYAERPDIDIDAGFYGGDITITIINNEPGSTIYYTTDGTRPSTLANVYSDPITLSETAIVKAYAVSDDPEVLPSFEIFNTYFVDDTFTLPVISISGTALDVLANGVGELEPQGTAEVFEVNGQRVARSYGEFNRHGQASWANDQRSLDFVGRDEMGIRGKIHEKLFRYSDRDRYQRIMLRAGGDGNYPGGSGWPGGGAHLRDAWLHNLCRRGNMNLDFRINEKYIVYLNGIYWGVYDMREKPDDSDFTKEYYNSDKYNIQYLLTWGNTWAQYGGQDALDDWQEFHDWCLSNDMTIQANYDQATSIYDLASISDYVIANSVSVCVDWLNWNCGWWRGTNDDALNKKWRFILWDNDATWGYHYDYTGIENDGPDAPPCQADNLPNIEGPWGPDPDTNGHVEILNHLRENPIADQYYISRYIDLRNTVFSCENMLSYLDTVVGYIQPEMPRHIQRWGGSMQEWEENVQDMYDFIIERCEYFSEGMVDCYDLTGPYEVTYTADPTQAATMKINSLEIDELPFTGDYFGGIDILVKAVPVNENYEFQFWSTDGDGVFAEDDQDSTSVQLAAENTITANFLSVDIWEAQNEGQSLTAHPSLFSDFTTINYTVSEGGLVALNLYGENGAIVAELLNRSNHATGTFNMKVDLASANLAPGMYYIQMVSGGELQVVKLMYTHR